MYMFYKADDNFKLLIALIKRARKENLTISVAFYNKEEAEDYSKKIWQAYESIPHGATQDPYMEMQPVWLDDNLYDFEVAILMPRFNDYTKLENYKKVLLIGEHSEYPDNAKYFFFKNDKWIECSRKEYF
jgi:DNA polymerase IIIc chi subunit